MNSVYLLLDSMISLYLQAVSLRCFMAVLFGVYTNSVVRTYCILNFLGEQMLLVFLENNSGLF